MTKNKIFVACDTTNRKKIRKIINETKNSKIIIGYKFGLQFLNSKDGRRFISKLKKEFDLEIEEVEAVKEDVTFRVPGSLS